MASPAPSPTVLFERELGLVRDPSLRRFAQACLEAAPAYFWRVSASTSGKHHLPFARGPGGLVRHTKAAVRVFLDLAEAYPCEGRDACVVALLIHDTLKCGLPPVAEPKTVAEHPLLPERHYAGLRGTIPEPLWEAVFGCVRSHMGRWGPVRPKTRDQVLVHLADYVASRKWVALR